MEQSNHTSTARRLLLGIVATGITLGIAAPARAQGFISPLIGYDAGGDAGCQDLSDCQDKKINVSVSFGALGNVFGVEEEIAYAPNFFGEAPGLSSSVLTLMSNVMLVPNLGLLRPYALVGIGLMKSHIELAPGSIFTADDSTLGWDIGGGLIVPLGEHIGLRGDIRYFHSFQDLEVLGFTLGDTKLNYGRASVGAVVKF